MRISASAVGVALIALGTAPAQAQVMNYGALEEIFGEPVTTSATGSPQKASDAPVNMEMITADDIRRSGADNIPDVLRSVAGIDVRRYGAAAADVGIRGYNQPNSPRVLVLVNGRQIYIDYHSYTAWALMPILLEEIRQIEVIRGPNTALYGFNAVAGVINIVTYDPVFDPVNVATVRVGTQHNQQVSSAATVKLADKVGLRLSASEHGAHEAKTADVLPSFGPYPSNAYNRSVSAHGRAQTGNGVDVTVEADAGDAKQFEMTVGGYPGWTAYTFNHEKVAVGGKTGLGYINLNAYRNEVTYQYQAGFNCVSCQDMANNLYVVQLTDVLKPHADHTVRLGLEYRNSYADGTIFGDEKLGSDVYAASAMWNWQLNPALALTNSARLDHVTYNFTGTVDPNVTYTAQQYNSRPITAPSFNSALVYKASSVDTVKVSVARGIQTPDFYALFPQPVSDDPAFSVGTIKAFQGTPNLKPTIVMNYGADYDRELPSLESKVQFGLFYQTSRDVLAPAGDAGVTDPVTNYGYSGNIGRSSTIGGEMTFKGNNAEGWRWKASYALAIISDNIAVNHDLSTPNSTVDNSRGTPTTAIGLGLGRTFSDFEVDLHGRWQSSYDDIGIAEDANGNIVYARQHLNNYVTVEGRVGYNATEKLNLAVSGQQLNRTTIATVNGPPTERRVLGTASLRF